jgi:hypothetical protein
MDETAKQYVFIGGSVVALGLWGISFFKPDFRSRAVVVSQHLIYQLLKEFESIKGLPPYFTWAYTLILTITELFGIGPFVKHSIASPIMLIRQINPYFDLYFDKRWSVLRLISMALIYRSLKSRFFANDATTEAPKIKEE